jgi:hypothetical protein
MSRVGLKSQAYTKVPAFAYAFGNTGVKINLSLIAKGDGIDADGNLIFDDVEGINHKEAFKIRDRFSKNVGTILVGKNDAHIIAAMADDRIDFIIPFHKSSWKESLYDALGLTGYDDYTNTQNEKPIDAGRKISNFAPSEYWDYSKSGDENAQIYLQKCKKDGRIPKFPQFQNYKGYWKLLIDFKMYDNDGVGSPQMPVKPTFENEDIKEILDEYKGGHRKLPVAQEVVDEFIKKKKTSGNDTKFQDRVTPEQDAEYLELAKNPEKNEARLREMVEEAAKKAGFNSPKLFHGTKQFGFTRLKTIDVESGVEWSPFFAASREDISASYVPYGKTRAISQETDYDYIEDMLEAKKEEMSDLISDFRRLIDRHISEWFFGQQGNSYLENLVENANYKAGEGDGIYDVLIDIVYDAFYEYHDDYFAEYEDADEWIENSSEGQEIVDKIVEIEGEKRAIHELEFGDELGGIYELYANLSNLFVVDANGVAWNELRPEGLPKLERYGHKDAPYETRDVALWARKNGYDGVIFKNIKDNGAYGRTPMGDVYTFFRPESQVKSADLVTYDDNGNIIPLSERFNEGNDDIRYQDRVYSGSLTQERNAEKVEDYFGVTDNYTVAGYITVNGKAIDFSGNKFGAKSNTRTIDHREIGDAFETEAYGEEWGYAGSMLKFMNEGNIRVTPETGGIELMSAPNPKQIPTLKDYIRHFDGKVIVDFDTFKGVDTSDPYNISVDMPVKSVEYSRKTSADKIVSDIINYFEKGVVPSNPTSIRDFLFQDRPISDREILVDAMSNIEELSIEDQNRLRIYKGKIDTVIELEKELADVGKQIQKTITTKGLVGSERKKQLEALYAKRDGLRKKISRADGELLKIEAMKPVQNLVEIRKKQVLNAYKQKAEEQRENKRDSRNKTATKNKIKRVIKTLESLYSNPTKEKNVKKEFQDMVAKALVMADVIFNDGNVSSTDILLGEITVRMSPKEAETLKKWKEVYKARQGYRDRLDALEASNKVNPKTHDELLDMISRCNNKLNRFAKELSDVVEAERGNRNNDVVQSAVDSLAKAYRSLKESPESYASAAYNEYVDKRLTALQDALDGVTAKTITQTQLDELYQAYKMVLTTVRTANDIFVKNKRASVVDMGEAVIAEVQKVAKITDDKSGETKAIRKFFWEELKPIYAFERIGSDTFTELYREVLRGQNIFASDVADSKRFFQEKSEKYNFNSWDFKDRKDFKLADGRTFTISLEEIMSIYAYSKRDQALDHMTDGGFVFEESELFTDNKQKGLKRFLKRERTTSEAYRLNDEVFYEIINSLTKEQKAFVDDMQDYLSTVMSAKGNEVSRVLYGIDLFKEKIYFPLITSQAFKQSPTEDAGEVSLKNWGATKPTKPHADNPIILRGFMDVWGEHVNKMSTYHSFVLPIENLNKVFNYTGYARQNKSVSVRTILAGAYGHEAANYIHNFIIDLNGGAKVQSSGGLPSQLVNKFKKTAVAASISVIVQQPTAVIRAMAMIDGKYFVHGTDGLKHNEAWEELKKYAPVAVLKEMGGFDVGSGKQVADFITAKSYEGIKEKTKGFFTDSSYRDEALMWGASKADEIGWITIWNAVKKEIADTTTYKKGSVEFLEACGERFTEVVAYTQVYDSVFSRSGFMRNKGEISKMATAFLGEATTSFNMLYNAILQGKRGNIGKGEVAKIIGATLTSIIAAAIAKSFIYALRDDDEDEAYVEKYTQALTGSLMDDLFIPNMLPYVKDLTSLLQGWEVERTDMAVIKDIKDAFDGLDSSSKSDYRKAEDLIGAIASVFGIPAKNLMRTGREIYNLFENLFDEDTLATSDVGGAAYEGVFGEITASDVNEQLKKGKTDKAKETMQKLISEKVESGKTEKEAKSALKASVTSYWKPLYLEAYKKGDTKEMYRIRMLLASLGLYDSTADTCSNWIKSSKDN